MVVQICNNSFVLGVSIVAVSAVWAVVQRSREITRKRRTKKEYEEELDVPYERINDSVASLLLKTITTKDDDDEGDQRSCIYLDYNGTTPIREEVVRAMIPYLTSHFGNPSSTHYYGTKPREAIQRARYQIATSLLISPPHANDILIPAANSSSVTSDRENAVCNSIIFTGCGTEANNMAIHLAINSWNAGVPNKRGGDNDDNDNNNKAGCTSIPHVVTSTVEHPAIVECLKFLERGNHIETTYVKVDEEGIVSATDIMSAVKSNTCLVTLMLANNESGAIMPVCEVARFCRSRGILFHTDAAQAVGKIDVSLEHQLGDADMVTLVGHKFGAPKGVAALYVRPGCLRENGRGDPYLYTRSGALLLGGGQEMGRRAGTENVPYIVGMGEAATLVSAGPKLAQNAVRMEELRTRLIQNLTKDLGADRIRVNGPQDAKRRLPNTLSVGIKDIHSGELLRCIGNEVAASAGSACHSSGAKVSSVLLAMNVPMNFAKGTLRLSVGFDTTEVQIDDATKVITREVRRQWATLA
jgi:cysteine desulfurase